jgi:hypothetical protein
MALSGGKIAHGLAVYIPTKNIFLHTFSFLVIKYKMYATSIRTNESIKAEKEIIKYINKHVAITL